MHVDKPSAIDFEHNGAKNRRNMHIDVRYLYIRQIIKKRVLELKYCPRDEMLADMLTKAIERDKLEKLTAIKGLKLAKSVTKS